MLDLHPPFKGSYGVIFGVLSYNTGWSLLLSPPPSDIYIEYILYIVFPNHTDAL